MQLADLLEKSRVALISLQERLNATTATGRLMMNLLASVSLWEGEVIDERTRDTMQHLKARGKVDSRPPFGGTYGDLALLTLMQQERA
jgi:site-specific DNA recombinase